MLLNKEPNKKRSLMQKNNFFTIITLLITMTTTPLIAMEQSLITKEKPKFVVALDLREASKEDVGQPWNKAYDEEDAHACKVLGITWEEGNNIYFTHAAGIRKCDETKYHNWKDNVEFDLPPSTIPYM